MGARNWFFLLVILVGCTPHVEPVRKIALLAPFEGRYREIGYDALYAARLAIADSGHESIDLLAIDDGGRVEATIGRALAIQEDPAIIVTIVLGRYATDQAVQDAFGTHPIIIVGNWHSEPFNTTSYMLSNPAISSQLTAIAETISQPTDQSPHDLIGGEVWALQQVPELFDDLSGITVLSSGRMPDSDFVARYEASAPFAPEPGLLATLTYDATAIAIETIVTGVPLQDIEFSGLNGNIQFEDGYWRNAPINTYAYREKALVLVNTE